MRTYNNLEQRMAPAFLDFFPPFVPLRGGEVTVEQQERFYGFMQNALAAFFETPEQFFSPIREDDAYPHRFNRTPYGKPRLIEWMRKTLKEIDAWVDLLFGMGREGALEGDRLALPQDFKIKKSYRDRLPLLGLTLSGSPQAGLAITCPRFEGLFPAWQWMARREGATALAFGRCWFDPAYPYLQTSYRKLLNSDAVFDRLTGYFTAQGYRRSEAARGPYTLDYARAIRDGGAKVGSPLFADPVHYGLAFDYTYENTMPAHLIVRIIEFKRLLLAFDRMPARAQRLLMERIKKCDHCHYCNQTDKTGKRPEAAIEVIYQGECHRLCPYFPGFAMSFDHLDEALAEDILALLGFMEETFAERAAV